jgi:4-hydroxythreonine-4-phosphate dehydrogenase
MAVRLFITLGDPAGIGPEIVLRALADPDVNTCANLVVVGERQLLQQAYDHLRLNTQDPLANPEDISLLECHTHTPWDPGQGNALSGAASFIYLKTAIEAVLAESNAGLVTAPIAKFAWHQAGYPYPGQTEVLAHLSHTQRYGMAFIARSPDSHWVLRVLLATTHIPLSQVPQHLTPELIEQKLDLWVDSLTQDFGLSDPVISVAGLNPHSGEGGHLGSEEKEWLIPCLENYSKARIRGPIPPDTLWVEPAQAWRGSHPAPSDAYLALYHDQGLIPVKMLAFDQAVNTTLGLPFIRTSPDHGTAFDIAGKGKARSSSLKAAILLASELVQQRIQSSYDTP